jgi:hypothetical protein
MGPRYADLNRPALPQPPKKGLEPGWAEGRFEQAAQRFIAGGIFRNIPKEADKVKFSHIRLHHYWHEFQ